jgi:hypothetical protein
LRPSLKALHCLAFDFRFVSVISCWDNQLH